MSLRKWSYRGTVTFALASLVALVLGMPVANMALSALCFLSATTYAVVTWGGRR